MGAAAAKASSAWERMFPTECRVVMFGLDASGKTTILYKLKLGEVVTSIPTVGFNVETIVFQYRTLTIWDLGLRDKARPLIRHYLPSTDALVLVVDSNDRDRIEEVREFLMYTLGEVQYQTKVDLKLLVFANKQDLPNAMTGAEVRVALGLDSARGLNWHLQSCCAWTGDGLNEGLSFLANASLPASIVPQGKVSSGFASQEAPLSNTSSTSLGLEASSVDQSIASASLKDPETPMLAPEDDDVFFDSLIAKKPLYVGVDEILRIAYLQRTRIPGSSARVSFESIKQLGSPNQFHATRTHFWINRLYDSSLGSASNSKAFLKFNNSIFPTEATSQEVLVRTFYSDDVLADPVAALIPLPPNLKVGLSLEKDSDDEFLQRVESPNLLRSDEMTSFRDLTRLAFVLLRRCETRRMAIGRMDTVLEVLAAGWKPSTPFTDEEEICTRPFHETKQYVALHLVHTTITTRPDLQKFDELAAVCPELSYEACIMQYYSEEALARGSAEFVVPDLQPLPTKVDPPSFSWHAELDDAAFLVAINSASFRSWGSPILVRTAYLFLKSDGRRAGLARLLQHVQSLREHPKSVGSHCSHETLAYFTMHMVHFCCSCAMWCLKEEPFSTFVVQHPEILEPYMHRDFYSDGVLYSKEARIGFVLPDLRPLPDLVPRSKS